MNREFADGRHGALEAQKCEHSAFAAPMRQRMANVPVPEHRALNAVRMPRRRPATDPRVDGDMTAATSVQMAVRVAGAAPPGHAAGLPAAEAALTELACLLGRQAAQRYRRERGLGHAAAGPMLFLVAAAVAAALWIARLLGGH